MFIQTNLYHGILLGSFLLLSTSIMAQEPPPPSDYTYNPPMATVLIVLIVVLFAIGFVSVYVRHFAFCLGINLLGRGPSRTRRWGVGRLRRGLDPATIDAFPTFLYSDVRVHRIGKSSLECAICLNEFDGHETLKLLPPCSHVFHPHCVAQWLESHVTCPVCRANLEIQPEVDRSLSFDSLIARHDELDQASENESEPSDSDHHRGVIGGVGKSPECKVAIKSPGVHETKGIGSRIGSLPRSHSTGHSLIEDCDERYTLKLPEEVRNKLVNFNNLSGLPAAIVSPKIGYRARSVGCAGIPGSKPDRWRFLASPTLLTRSSTASASKPDSVIGSSGSNDLNNNNSSMGSTGILSGPMNLLKSIRSPLNRVNRSTNDIGERSSDKLWSKGASQHDMDLESQPQ